MIATEDQLLPKPRRVRRLPGAFDLAGSPGVVMSGDDTTIATPAVQILRRHFQRSARAAAHKKCKRAGKHAGRIVIERIAGAPHEQWYSLHIRPGEIRLQAADAAGLRYGATTLGQLLKSGCRRIRAMAIEDWPDFKVRGVMLDISRDKVPKMSTLRRLVDMLAGWKINQLQLYTEHTFAYVGHERVWRAASPMTGRQIEELDHYCRERGVELVPNQNSFGHMERWLRHEPYAALAETHGRWRTPWGTYRDYPTTLNPLDSRSIRLVESLYEQLLPHFSGRLFNVGCDETFELGQGRSAAACRRRGAGRVYLDFLLKIYRAVRRHGRRMMFWADVAFQHPELIGELPDDVIPLIWGYEADHPFDEQCRRVARRGLEFYVCPGTSSWCSFGGRTSNCIANLHNAAESGARHGATGYLITDWGDYGHRQYLPASYVGFLYGAAVSWCVESNASIDVPVELARHAFDDATGLAGKLWCEVGRIHELSGVAVKNRTVLFNCLHGPLGDAAAIKGLNERKIARMQSRIEKLATQARRAAFGGDDGELVREELLATLAVLRHACRRAMVAVKPADERSIRSQCRWLAVDMERIIERHRRLWLARNRPGGLASSAGYYRRNLEEYRFETKH